MSSTPLSANMRKVLPAPSRSSSQTNVQTNSSVYVTLDAHEKTSSQDSERRYQQWIYRYPRLSFFILMIGFSMLSSAFGAYYCTHMLLYNVLPVSQALKVARNDYFTTSLVLNNMSHCVQSTVLPTIIHTKAVIDNETLMFQNQVSAMDTTLSSASSDLEQCLDSTLTTYEDYLASNDLNRTQLSCLSEGVMRMRATETGDSILRQVISARLSPALLTAATRLDKEEMKVIPMSKINEAASVVHDSTAAWWSDLKKSMVSDLTTLADGLDVGTPSASALVLEALQGDVAENAAEGGMKLASTIETKLFELLKAIPRVHQDVKTAANTVDKAWNAVVQTLTINQGLENRLHDVVNATNTTAINVLNRIENASDDLKTVFDRSMTELLQAVDYTVHHTLNTAFSRWNEILETTSSHLHLKTALQPRSYRRTVLSPNNTLPNITHEAMKNIAVRPIPQHKTWHPILPELTLDDAVFRGSIFEAISMWLIIISILDLMRVLGSLVQNGLDLMSNNLSYLNPIDIREQPTVSGVFGRMDKHTIIYAVVNQGYMIITMFTRVFLWSLFEMIGTSVLVSWKEDYLTTCNGTIMSEDAKRKMSETTPWGLVLLGALIPNVTIAAVSPWTEYMQVNRDQEAFIEDATDKLTRSLQSVWKYQASKVQEMMDERLVASTLQDSMLNCSRGAIHTSLMGSCPLTISQDAALISHQNTSIIKERLVNALEAHQTIIEKPSTCFNNTAMKVDNTLVHQRIQHFAYRQYCAREKVLYLTVASWWIWITLYRLFHILSYLLIHALGISWWRFLSCNRLTFLGYCFDDGRMDLTSQDLENATERQLREIRWRVGIRVVCAVILMIVSSMVVYITFQRMI